MSGPSAPRPRLVSVDGNPPKDEKPAPTSAAPGHRRRWWLLLALAAIAGIGLVVQSVRVQTLSGELEVLTGELFTARSALAAYDSRFREVRATVEGLQAQFEQLGALVASDPGAEAPAGAPGTPPVASD